MNGLVDTSAARRKWSIASFFEYALCPADTREPSTYRMLIGTSTFMTSTP